MSDFHVIGENRLIAQINGADLVRTVVVAGKIYAYWRNALTVGMEKETTVMVSTSTDGKIWTTPAMALSRPGYDLRLGGVIHNGSQFYMVWGEMSVPGGTVNNYFVTSAAGLTYGGISSLPFAGDYFACVSDFAYANSTYYVAASCRSGAIGTTPHVAKLQSSTNMSAWTSLGYASQLTTVENVHPRIAVSGSIVHMVMREGPYFTFSGSDRILYTSYNTSARTWSPTTVVTTGTGDPGIVSLSDGYAIIYHDTKLSKQYGQWSWVFYDGATFVRRGTFSQGWEGGAGGAAFAWGDDFAVVYAVRPNTASATGTLFFRDFNLLVDQPDPVYAPLHQHRVEREPELLDNFEIVISSGTTWYSLTDNIRFYASAEDYGDKAQVLRRITAQSPYYDGTYLIHSVKENVQESLTVGILGGSQNQVTENMLLLEELVSQPSFRIRLTMGDHQETWLCQSADYTIQRGHINMHNTRAMMRLMIPRLPQVSYEVI